MNKRLKSSGSVKQGPVKVERLDDNRIDYDKSIKVIFLGDSNVGKSSIIERIKKNTFNINQRATISLEHHNLIIQIDSYIIRLQIWDTAGQEKFNSITSSYYKSTDVVIFVYSINSRNSFERITQWAKQVDDNSSKDEQQLRFLIGNKSDLNSDRQVTLAEGKDLADKLGCIHFSEISCMEKENEENNNNISNIIDIIARKIYNQHKVGVSDRLNSGSYNYVATESILLSDNNSNKNKKKKCSC